MTTERDKLPFVDALRGIAIVLVVASHAFPAIRELPWTVKRFTNLGFLGVQLFFVVSSLTLARSWRQRERVGRPSAQNFMIRRLFRIAPAYFLGALLYLWVQPGPWPDAARILTFVTFTNGWSPSHMPTVAGAWVGVPGGWSVEAECGFYALFPLLMIGLRGLAPALVAFLLSLPLAWAANGAGLAFYTNTYGFKATDQFLYYWLPNEIPVFLCGLLLFEILERLSPSGAWSRLGVRLADRWWLLLLGSGLLFLSLGILPWPRRPEPAWAFVPSTTVAALAFMGLAVALALRPGSLFVNRPLVAVGEASFSVYILHFAVLQALVEFLPGTIANTAGLAAVAAGAGMFATVLGVTALASRYTYRLIEKPGIRLGHRVNRWLEEDWPANRSRRRKSPG